MKTEAKTTCHACGALLWVSVAVAGTAAVAQDGPIDFRRAALIKLLADDIVVSDPEIQLGDPEFDPTGNALAWQDGLGRLWVASIDPETGAIEPENGMGTQVDSDLAPVNETLNGPEWAYGDDGTYLVYTRKFGEIYQLAAARRQRNGSYNTSTLREGTLRYMPIGTPLGTPGNAAIVYSATTPNGDNVGYREIEDEETEQFLQTPLAANARFVEGTNLLVASAFIGQVWQVVLVDRTTNELTQITFDAGNKFFPTIWAAPEFDGALTLMVSLDNAGMGLRVQSGEDWPLVGTVLLPSPKPLVHSPEVFLYHGRSFISVVAADELGGGGGWIGQPEGPTEIWLAGVDPAAPFYRRVDTPLTEENRLDPESFVLPGGPVLYYTERPGPGTILLRRANTHLGPEH